MDVNYEFTEVPWDFDVAGFFLKTFEKWMAILPDDFTNFHKLKLGVVSLSSASYFFRVFSFLFE